MNVPEITFANHGSSVKILALNPKQVNLLAGNNFVNLQVIFIDQTLKVSKHDFAFILKQLGIEAKETKLTFKWTMSCYVLLFFARLYPFLRALNSNM